MSAVLASTETLSAALKAGHIIVLRCRSDSSIGAAREAARRASAWLGGITALGRGQLSRSAAPGMGLVAAQLHFPVGIDVEALGGAEGDGNETGIWVRKEAVLKSFGGGLGVAPTGLLTGGANPAWRQVAHRSLGMAWLRTLEAAPGFAMAVATRAPQPPPLLCIDFDD